MKLRTLAFSKRLNMRVRFWVLKTIPNDPAAAAFLTSLTWIVLLSVELFLRWDVSDSTQRELTHVQTVHLLISRLCRFIGGRYAYNRYLDRYHVANIVSRTWLTKIVCAF